MEDLKMKKTLFYLMTFLSLVFLNSCCKPCADLSVSAFVKWNDNVKQVYVTVYNNGTASAKGFMVYINADENPESQNHRPQVSHRVDSLAGCSHITLPISDFKPLEHPDNHNLNNVYQISVIVDPKNQVKECTKCAMHNNTITIPLH
jgi:hypothetical protein